MEKMGGCILRLSYTILKHGICPFKMQLMISKPTAHRLILVAFMVLVGFSLAKAIYSQSIIGVLLSVVSLVAGFFCLYLLGKAREEA
jgi:hypothetical protein